MVSTHLKNIRKWKWEWFPQIGLNIKWKKKYLKNQHLVESSGLLKAWTFGSQVVPNCLLILLNIHGRTLAKEIHFPETNSHFAPENGGEKKSQKVAIHPNQSLIFRGKLTGLVSGRLQFQNA